MTNARDIKKIELRLPLDLHAALVERARRNNRSVNAEIVAELEQAEDADFIARYGPAIRREVNAVLAEQPHHE